MEVPFTRLVRFKTPGGDVVYGEAGDEWKGDLVGKTLSTFSGNDPFTLRSSSDKAVVSEVSFDDPNTQAILATLEVITTVLTRNTDRTLRHTVGLVPI